MKNLFCLTTILCFISCTTDLIRRNIEAELLKTMDDPGSYEFVEYAIVDTVTYGDILAPGDLTYIDNFREMLNMYSDVGRKEEYVAEITKIKTYIYSDSLQRIAEKELFNSLGDSITIPAYYNVNYVFRGNNKMGALILDTIKASLFADLTIHNLSDETFSAHPKIVPGYTERVTIYDIAPN